MKVNIFSDEWCDLVFADKNKAYGAYKLRKLENKRILISMFIATFLFLGIISYPLILRAMKPIEKERKTDLTKFALVVFEKPKTIVEETKVSEKTSNSVEKVIKQIKFTAPVIVSGETKENIKSQDSLAIEPGQISNIDVKKGEIEHIEKPLPPNPSVIAPEPSPEPIRNASQMPEFAGGLEDLRNYLSANIHYPQMAKETGITGIVNIEFVVESDGSISRLKILRGIGGGCDEEAYRVIANMPKWKPGRQNGRAVAVYFMIPIKFSMK